MDSLDLEHLMELLEVDSLDTLLRDHTKPENKTGYSDEHPL